MRCGNPHDPRGGVDALWNPATSDQGWFACPDNSCVDDEGRLWIATDQGDNWARTGRADGLYGLETEGTRRGRPRCSFAFRLAPSYAGRASRPIARRCSSPCNILAPMGPRALYGFGLPSTYKRPATRWPDFREDRPPRPSVVTITKIGGGKIA